MGDKGGVMRVEFLRYDDLPEDVKEDQPNNGSGKEYSSYLMVKFPEQEPRYFSDAMEPEDACFGRDLSWVKDIILEAYEKGMTDAFGMM
jgi:hypothetical protein